ncbi:MAG TPA: very short patch repair endonuclease [Stellaceae bacterium]|nr:very short patch repair endonuclease [Stellaceae bacterium]
MNEQRSRIMRAVRSKDTAPEMLVRRLLHSMGYRYRLHAPDVPGRPDIVNKRRRIAIFVHGCFWHGHECRRGARLPKENAMYWSDKIARNRRRDASVIDALFQRKWLTLVIWECEIRCADLETRLRTFLARAAHEEQIDDGEPE